METFLFTDKPGQSSKSLSKHRNIYSICIPIMFAFSTNCCPCFDIQYSFMWAISHLIFIQGSIWVNTTIKLMLTEDAYPQIRQLVIYRETEAAGFIIIKASNYISVKSEDIFKLPFFIRDIPITPQKYILMSSE